jgi:Caspase domain
VKDAASTWAVVIGIDTYDNFRHLKGAAADSVATVTWLRRLGVPDAQIMVHAAPSAASRESVEGLGLPIGGCAAPEIWTSFERLRKNRGERLFVFLAGHGLYEPSGHRVFLTREADQDTVSNLGIAWYARLLRGLDYKLQILVMDGCLNVPYDGTRRAQFKEGEILSVEPKPPLDTSMQVLCCGAKQGQTALEVKGRGLFTAKLLEALDPDEPDPRCVDIDEETGAVQLDIFRAVQEVAGPATLAAAGRSQTPVIQYLSETSTPRVFPAVELATAEPARLSVSVEPGAALADVRSVTLSCDDNEWRRKLLPAELETAPCVSVLPPNLSVSLRCLIKPQTDWIQPGQEDLVTDGDMEVVFELQPPAEGAASPPAIQTVDSDGNVVRAIDIRRVEIDRAIEELGGRPLEIRELAPGGRSGRGGFRDGLIGEESLTFDLPEGNDAWGSETTETAFEVAELLTERAPAGVHAVVREEGALESVTALEIPMTHTRAIRLAGFWSDEAVIKVGDTSLRPDDLVASPLVPVDGPTTVRIELPWGAWSQRFDAPRGRTTRIELPDRIGVPPLRALMLKNEGGEPDRPHSVIAARADLAEAVVVDPDGRPLEARLRRRPRDGFSAWTGSTFDVAADGLPAPRWQRYVLRDGLQFPLSEIGGVALNLGRAPRAEPLSRTRSKQWDGLVAFGELARLDESKAESLASRKWEDLLLGLAGAYACYANRQDSFLEGTLENLRGLDPDLPDVALLEAALDARLGRDRREVSERLWRAGLPVFRWGVAIGQVAADHYGDHGLGERLRTVERGLVRTSTWTLWYRDDVR